MECESVGLQNPLLDHEAYSFSWERLSICQFPSVCLRLLPPWASCASSRWDSFHVASPFSEHSRLHRQHRTMQHPSCDFLYSPGGFRASEWAWPPSLGWKFLWARTRSDLLLLCPEPRVEFGADPKFAPRLPHSRTGCWCWQIEHILTWLQMWEIYRSSGGEVTSWVFLAATTISYLNIV